MLLVRFCLPMFLSCVYSSLFLAFIICVIFRFFDLYKYIQKFHLTLLCTLKALYYDDYDYCRSLMPTKYIFPLTNNKKDSPFFTIRGNLKFH